MKTYMIQLTPRDEEQACLYLSKTNGFERFIQTDSILLLTEEEAEAVCTALDYTDTEFLNHYSAIPVRVNVTALY